MAEAYGAGAGLRGGGPQGSVNAGVGRDSRGGLGDLWAQYLQRVGGQNWHPMQALMAGHLGTQLRYPQQARQAGFLGQQGAQAPTPFMPKPMSYAPPQTFQGGIPGYSVYRPGYSFFGPGSAFR